MSAYSELAYLAATALFVGGLKRLGSPATARRGNFLAALGMLVAVIATVFAVQAGKTSLIYLFGAVVVGSTIGWVMATKVQMTAMPQMVALLNGFGGGASALVGAAEFTRLAGTSAEITLDVGIAIQFSVFVGTFTFSGSGIAFGKLQELLSGRPITYPLQKTVNALLFLGAIALVVYLVTSPEAGMLPFVALGVVSLLLGILFVLPIGGADMPVVISLLNSFSGVAASIAGFVIKNNGLIVGGALVGASGLILTQIMCKGMNRSLANVLFSAFGQSAASGGGAAAGDQTYREIQAGDAAVMVAYSRLVIVVPGYGLAVAQAQHVVRELASMLEKRNVEVKYAIHPVAGRMPGHMNVLLAEADVPYDQLYDMEQINPEFDRADVAIVIGANDVVNPAARTDPSSPIYGMPILEVENAQSCIVLKRSMRPGFAGIENELFFKDKTSMLFGDAKDSIQAVIQELKEL